MTVWSAWGVEPRRTKEHLEVMREEWLAISVGVEKEKEEQEEEEEEKKLLAAALAAALS